jgi:hypothetical protein
VSVDRPGTDPSTDTAGQASTARPARPRTLVEVGVWTTVDGVRVLVDPRPGELAEEIRLQFWRAGIAHTSLAKRAFSAGQWRAVARMVGRGLGRPVQTVQNGQEVRARLKDWPANDRETHVYEERMRRWIAASACSTTTSQAANVDD